MPTALAGIRTLPSRVGARHAVHWATKAHKKKREKREKGRIKVEKRKKREGVKWKKDKKKGMES